MAEALHHAACSCGQLTAACRGDPVRVSACHCLNCQRRTGGPFAVQARFPVGRVTISGERASWVRQNESGSSATFSFCPTCSSIVFYHNSPMPDLLAIPLGAFADPSFPAPWVQVFQNRQHPWIHLDVPDEVMD